MTKTALTGRILSFEKNGDDKTAMFASTKKPAKAGFFMRGGVACARRRSVPVYGGWSGASAGSGRQTVAVPPAGGPHAVGGG